MNLTNFMCSVSMIVLTAGCAVQAGDTRTNPTYNGPVTSEGQPDMNANYLLLPDGSQVRVWQATRASDDEGLFQYGVVGTARTYPGGRTEMVTAPMYNQSAGGWWANAGVGLVQSGAAELGGLVFLGGHQASSNINIAGNNTNTNTNGNSATSSSSSSVHNSNSSTNVNSLFQQQQQQQHQGQHQGQHQFLVDPVVAPPTIR